METVSEWSNLWVLGPPPVQGTIKGSAKFHKTVEIHSNFSLLAVLFGSPYFNLGLGQQYAALGM